MRYNIAVAADNNYFVPMYVMLVSLFTNNENSSYNLYVLHKEIQDENKQALTILASQYNCTIEWLNISDVQTGSFYTSHYITEAAYYRIYIPQLLPADIDRVLYLDCDIIVSGDITELYKKSFDGKTLITVAEAADYNKEWLDIPGGKPVFNSGVLLINLKEWRDNEYTTALLNNIYGKHHKYLMHDQDALNEFFFNNVKLIEAKWNFQTAVYTTSRKNIEIKYNDAYQHIIDTPIILHYTGISKPWQYMNIHPRKHDFIYFLKQTPYAKFLGKPTIAMRVKKLVSRIKHKLSFFN